MKTLLFLLMPLILFSGCVHKVPSGHAIGYSVPVYQKKRIIKTEHTYSPSRDKKKRKGKVHNKKLYIPHAKAHRAMR